MRQETAADSVAARAVALRVASRGQRLQGGGRQDGHKDCLSCRQLIDSSAASPTLSRAWCGYPQAVLSSPPLMSPVLFLFMVSFLFSTLSSALFLTTWEVIQVSSAALPATFPYLSP